MVGSLAQCGIKPQCMSLHRLMSSFRTMTGIVGEICSGAKSDLYTTIEPRRQRKRWRKYQSNLAKEVPVRTGDYVALLSGPDGAHQTFNDSNVTLRYLCLSTMIEPEVNFYPKSNRIGFFAGAAPGGDREQRFVEGFVPLNASVDYWTGEKSNGEPER
jgi:hypothetical protein